MRAVEEMRYLMVAAQRGSKRMFTVALRPLGVTLAQAEALRLLERREPLTLSGLGELLLYESGGNASRLVDHLVTNGLVHRVTAVCDRRRVDITLTAAGRRFARQIAGIDDRIYENLDALGEGHDVAAVIAYLRAVVAGTRGPQDRPLTGTGGSSRGAFSRG